MSLFRRSKVAVDQSQVEKAQAALKDVLSVDLVDSIELVGVVELRRTKSPAFLFTAGRRKEKMSFFVNGTDVSLAAVFTTYGPSSSIGSSTLIRESRLTGSDDIDSAKASLRTQAHEFSLGMTSAEFYGDRVTRTIMKSPSFSPVGPILSSGL